MAKRKVVIDCDTGIDDAVALLLALECPDIEILAITCVYGNCLVDKAVHNTLVTLKIAQKKVPVYRGCCKPLSVSDNATDEIHGNDGLGGIAGNFEPCTESLQPGHASNVLVDIVNKNPGEVILITLGPLTNIALAYRLDDSFSSKLKRMLIMGGNTEGKGNKKLASEFNFLVDPEAAQIVTEETKCDFQICGWETCGLNNCLTYEWADQYLMTGNPKTEKARFIEGMIGTFYQIRRKRWPTSFAMCDPVAMAVALYPDIVRESTFQKVGVETAGTLTRGMMVPEWRAGLFPRDVKPAELILKINMEMYIKLLEKLVSAS